MAEREAKATRRQTIGFPGRWTEVASMHHDSAFTGRSVYLGRDWRMAGLKYSRQRESIKNYLRDREDHPTADRIYADIRKEFPNISLGTVYRNLSLLVNLGEIQKIPTQGADRFDARPVPHNHFICKRCGRVLDVLAPTQDLALDMNRRWPHGDVEGCRIEFYGICNPCKETHSPISKKRGEEAAADGAVSCFCE